MKKISVLIPCYNEEENVVPISEAVIGIITKELPQYDYELVFIDNDSTDKTRELLRTLCAKNPKFIFQIDSMPAVIRAVTYIIPARYFVSTLQSLFLAGNIPVVLVVNVLFLIASAVM